MEPLDEDREDGLCGGERSDEVLCRWFAVASFELEVGIPDDERRDEGLGGGREPLLLLLRVGSLLGGRGVVGVEWEGPLLDGGLELELVSSTSDIPFEFLLSYAKRRW